MKTHRITVAGEVAATAKSEQKAHKKAVKLSTKHEGTTVVVETWQPQTTYLNGKHKSGTRVAAPAKAKKK